MDSLNFVEENITKLAALFPGCVTESAAGDGKSKKAIDFDLLRQELSTVIVEGPQERYQLDWPGKREALLTANAPIAKTLRPCREESVEFETTENLFIEGDNLDALKLLQASYLGKIKMIYIDPPYNTGKDFIYADNFAESAEEYLLDSGQKDEEGRRFFANRESNGRFHSDWLSMIYPRIKLARNLLKDNGVMFISIDEIELAKLRMICDEVFGEENHIADFVWHNKKGGGNDAKHVAVEHEYIIMYAKDKISLHNLFEPYSPEYLKRYKEEDDIGRFFWDTYKRKSGKQYYPITAPDGTILEIDFNGNPISWLRSEAKFQRDLKDGEVRFIGGDGKWSVHFKQRLPQGKKPRSIFLSDSIWHDTGTTSDGSFGVLELFGKNVFDNPKPIRLLQKLIGFNLNEDEDIVLDFFAGSATTAHAVMQFNAEDNGKRKFIMVQLPEACNKKSEAFQAGYKTIAEIGKERIRRAGKKIKGENASVAANLDTGFRVLKVDSSNMADVYYTPAVLAQRRLQFLTDNIKDDRRAEDLLFQILLDWGVDLTLPLTQESIGGRELFFVGGNGPRPAIAACLEQGAQISEEFCKELAARRPLRVVFRDSGFKNDSIKINMEQIFRLISPHTDVKTI